MPQAEQSPAAVASGIRRRTPGWVGCGHVLCNKCRGVLSPRKWSGQLSISTHRHIWIRPHMAQKNRLDSLDKNTADDKQINMALSFMSWQ